MATRALIIGGSGQIGYAAARALLADGWEVTVGHRGRQPLPADLDVPAVVVDRADTAALTAAAAGYDLVLDTVAFTPEHARQLVGLDVGTLAVVSTGGVYLGANGSYLDLADSFATFPDYAVGLTEDWPTIDNAEQTYGPLKAAMERELLAGPTPVVILRAGAVHGPYSPVLREWFFIKRALDGRSRVLLPWRGSGRFHPASTTNIAALVVAAVRAGGTHVLNAVDDQSPTDAEIARTVFAAMGHDAEIIGFDGPGDDGVGQSPFGVPKPFVLSMARAHALGYAAPLTYPEAVAVDVAWALEAVRAAEQRGGTWEQAFPAGSGFATGWFDYEAEDRWTGPVS